MATGVYGKHQELRNLQVQFAELASDIGTATTASGAATLNDLVGKITTEALTTAAGANATVTLTNSRAAAGDSVVATMNGGTTTAGTPVMVSAVPAAGSIVFTIKNDHASDAFNGTIVFSYIVISALSGIV